MTFFAPDTAPAGPASPVDANDDEQMFELAPVSLWLEDYSAVRDLFDAWRSEGVTDLRAHLSADRSRVQACSRAVKVLRVNRRTLELFGATDMAQLVCRLDMVFRDAMFDSFVEELASLWEGRGGFANQTVNYTLDGRPLHILVHGKVLPGHEARWDRVLVSIEDISRRVEAERQLVASEAYARGLFEHSPVSLWVEDFSAVKRLLDEARAAGIQDFRTFIDVHPEFVDRCMQEIRVIDVNRRTLELFAAPDKPTLLRRLGEVFRDDMRNHFAEQLIELWDGKLVQQRETVNYALDGDTVHVHLQFSVLPGHEDDWSLVLVSLTDITARKKAEAYLEFLGKHDVLTKLRNRSYYIDELNRLQRKGPFPIGVIVADLNGLKDTNDQLGHAAGDALLQRAGEVLAKAVDHPACAARIGGDEFAVLMPATDRRGAEQVLENIQRIVELNNSFYGGTPLSFSMGLAVCEAGERLEDAIASADAAMYVAKRQHYESQGRDRRNSRY